MGTQKGTLILRTTHVDDDDGKYGIFLIMLGVIMQELDQGSMYPSSKVLWP